MTRNEIMTVINEMQNAASAYYGSGNGHAWSSGYLGAILVDTLYRYAEPATRDAILRSISENTNRMNAEISARNAA